MIVLGRAIPLGIVFLLFTGGRYLFIRDDSNDLDAKNDFDEVFNEFSEYQ